MKKLSYLSMLLVVLVFIGCSDNTNVQKISVRNNLNIERIMETVEVSLSDILFINENTDLERVAVFNNDKQQVSQIIDSDNNGIDDAVIFQDSFKPNEEKKYSIKLLEEKTVFNSKVYAAFIKGREDIAWENDKVAFRMYGPPLAANVNNGIDVWSKRVDYLIIDKWYNGDTTGISYHKDHGEGADFYSVGKSLGAGGSAIMADNKLYQSGVYTNYKIFQNGPLQLKFELNYLGFDVNGTKINEKKIISLNAGSQLNKVISEYSELPESSFFTAGLVIRENIEEYMNVENSIISLWGNNSDNEEDGQTGIAVIYPAKSQVTKTEDTPAHLLVTDRLKSDSYVYYTGACWTKAEVIKSKFEWETYLSEFKEKLSSPLSVEKCL
ncbi:MAG: DUF4861 domain-containing protein [Melioribacteraceae bacterium]|nr:DUF4861 domain-containing protein [Melioribacteraceae bacterium]